MTNEDHCRDAELLIILSHSEAPSLREQRLLLNEALAHATIAQARATSELVSILREISRPKVRRS